MLSISQNSQPNTMFLPDDQPAHIEQLSSHLRTLGEELLIGLEPCAEDFSVHDTEDIFNDYSDLTEGRILQVVDGTIQAEHHGGLLYHFEDGDLVGLLQAFTLPAATLCSEHAVTLRPFNRRQFFQHVNRDNKHNKRWNYYLLGQTALLNEALGLVAKRYEAPTPGFLHFAAGDTIIQQGDDADCVFTIIEGQAEVFKDAIKVGEISDNEIFGAMAVFSNTQRTATVIAQTPCSVIAVPKEQFIDLIQYQPHTCQALIENLVNTINDLNRQVLALQAPANTRQASSLPH